MDSFEFNKIAGAVLGTLTLTMGLGIASEILFEPEAPEKPGYEIAAVDETAPAEGGGNAAAAEPPIETFLAKASVDAGRDTAKACAACHTFEKGGPNKVGPNLFGVVGRPKAGHEGFGYSEAMKAAGGTWTIQDLNHFINNPKGFVPKTAMTFNGLKKPEQRANVLAFLNSLSDNPQPLPTAAPDNAAAPAGGADAAGGGNAAPAEGAPANNAAPAAGGDAPKAP